MELSRNDIEVRANDIEMSLPVDFVSMSVDFRSVVAASLESLAIDITHDLSSRYGRRISETRSKKAAFRVAKDEKTPEKPVLEPPQLGLTSTPNSVREWYDALGDAEGFVAVIADVGHTGDGGAGGGIVFGSGGFCDFHAGIA